ncbi:MAG: ThiF family adenylyltransferase [Bacilli bacterium]|nr:ThiF family adenylyltransferase [Bacilli bacterium]
MLIINSFKPFYIDKENKVIRMGNFKDSGKEIEYEDDSLIKLFNMLSEPIEREDLVNGMEEGSDLTKEDINAAIDYLIDEGFIIDNDEYNNIINDNRLNRQKLYFSMCSDHIENWNIDKQPNILILGLGGVGSNASVLLSRAGFNTFTLVDCDVVEESNLIRQIPYTENDIGKKKTDVMLEHLKDNCNVKTINKRIEKEEDIEEEIKKADFVLCTLDKPSRVIRRLINNVCVKYKKPVIFSGFAEHVAMIGPFIEPSKSACLKCIERDRLDEPLDNVKITPSYGPLCLLISSIVSNEIINYFYKFNDNNLIGKTLMINMLTYEQNIIEWEKKNDCEVCGSDSK